MHCPTPIQFALTFITATVFLLLPPSVGFANHEVFNDADIQVAIHAKLMRSPDLNPDAVHVEVEGGRVLLTGEVANYLQRQIATNLSGNTRGVIEVVNRLEVPTTLEDAIVLEHVLLVLGADPHLHGCEVAANVNEGLVSLSGIVGSWQQRYWAEQQVLAIAGVVAVDNQLAIAYSESHADDHIQAEVVNRLLTDSRLHGDLISVAVSSGNVQLGGAVGSMTEKRLAVSLAWVHGVQTVDTANLEVRYWTRGAPSEPRPVKVVTDSSIRDAVLLALRYEVSVDETQVSVEANTGIVRMTGAVGSLYARNRAQEIAESIVGVRRVDNFITVQPAAPLTSADVAGVVRDALRLDGFVDATEVTATAYEGRVYLHGRIPTSRQRKRCEWIASMQPGVVAVENEVEVGQWTLKVDGAIFEDIKSQMYWSPILGHTDAIQIATDNGFVTLTGRVDSVREHLAATKNAYDGGARSVRNDIRIQ